MSAMSAVQTRKWITFFQAAGIHDDVLAARYAAIFVENEIHTSMLNELDMELLRVMGISKVGHVLGILKHAKLVHDTQLFADSQPSPPSASQSSGSSSPIVRNTDAKNGRPTTMASTSRIIKHYVRKPASNVDSPQRPAVLDRVGVASKKPRPKVMGRLASDSLVSDKIKTTYRAGNNITEKQRSAIAHRVEMESRPTQSVASGRVMPAVSQRTKLMNRLGSTVAVEKPVPVSQPVNRKRPITVKSDQVAEEVQIAKRPRRVLPEHEGGYSISMPSGSTPRSREILAKMARQSKTVFDRLGDPAVSSTTEMEVPTKVIETYASMMMKLYAPSGSVFNRLGGKAGVVSPASPQAANRPVLKGIKARLGKQVNVKPMPMVRSHTKIESTVQPKSVPGVPRKVGISIRSEATPSSTTHTEEMPYSGILKKQYNLRKIPVPQTRFGSTPQAPIYPSVETAAKRNSSAGILGNPVNATKLSAKARLDLSARPPVNTDPRSRTRKFIMTNRKTGVQTIVYKITQE